MEYINNETNQIMTRDEAVEWLKENIGIKFEFTLDRNKIEKQAETEQILLDSYFWTQKAREREYEEDGVRLIDIRIGG